MKRKRTCGCGHKLIINIELLPGVPRLYIAE